MYRSAWTYPWDVSRLGVDRVLDDLARCGLHGIDLAATYHPLSAISPRGDRLSLFFSPSGGVFFPARPERYGAIEPRVWAESSVTDVWHAVAERLPDHGLELNAWTICLFQPWLAQLHPHTARVYATGTPLDTGVCVSNPEVQAYLRALVGDLVDQFTVATVKLEGIAPPRFDYGWTRRRLYTTLTPAQEAALSACFCDACMRGASSAGIDAEQVRAAASATLTMHATDPDARLTATALDEHALVDEYAMVARRAAAALVRDLADVAHRAGSRIAVATPVDGTAAGVPIEDVVDHIDVVMLAGLPRDRVALTHVVDVIDTASAPPALEYFLHPPFNSHATGALPSGIDDELEDPGWRSELAEAIAVGVSRLSVYNYGLLTEETFERLASIARSVERRG